MPREGWGGQRIPDSVGRPSKRPRVEIESEQGVESHKTSMSYAERLVMLALANAPIPLTDRGILQLNGHTGYPWPWLLISKV